MTQQQEIHRALILLRSSNGAFRERARKKLIGIGRPAVEHLIRMLDDADSHSRWEACMALRFLREPTAIRPLIKALKDSSSEVRWLAAESLLVIGERSIIPLLRELETNFNSVYLRDGARHILQSFHHQKKLRGRTPEVLHALVHMVPAASIGVTAKEAIDSISESIH